MVAQTTIQSPSSNYSVNFEGIIGNGYQGDIAIDDVSVVPGTCTLPGTVIQVLNVCENVKKNDCCRLSHTLPNAIEKMNDWLIGLL